MDATAKIAKGAPRQSYWDMWLHGSGKGLVKVPKREPTIGAQGASPGGCGRSAPWPGQAERMRPGVVSPDGGTVGPDGSAGGVDARTARPDSGRPDVRPAADAGRDAADTDGPVARHDSGGPDVVPAVDAGPDAAADAVVTPPDGGVMEDCPPNSGEIPLVEGDEICGTDHDAIDGPADTLVYSRETGELLGHLWTYVASHALNTRVLLRDGELWGYMNDYFVYFPNGDLMGYMAAFADMIPEEIREEYPAIDIAEEGLTVGESITVIFEPIAPWGPGRFEGDRIAYLVCGRGGTPEFPRWTTWLDVETCDTADAGVPVVADGGVTPADGGGVAPTDGGAADAGRDAGVTPDACPVPFIDAGPFTIEDRDDLLPNITSGQLCQNPISDPFGEVRSTETDEILGRFISGWAPSGFLTYEIINDAGLVIGYVNDYYVYNAAGNPIGTPTDSYYERVISRNYYEVDGTPTRFREFPPIDIFDYGEINASPENYGSGVIINLYEPGSGALIAAYRLGLLYNVGFRSSWWDITNCRPPRIDSVVPASAYAGETLDVTINGENFFHVTTTRVLDFGSGIRVNSLEVVSETELRVNITVSDTASAGPRDVTWIDINMTPRTLEGAFMVETVSEEEI